MDTKLRINSKSFFYNLVSHGYYVYRSDDYNKFLIQKLICADCHDTWPTSLRECFLCGTENYHVYTCTTCGFRRSITASSIAKCPKCDAKNSFSQLCVNDECITNTNLAIREKVISTGGVFDGNGGFTTRQQSCKKCGSRNNHYVSAECEVVSNKEQLSASKNAVFIEREADDLPANAYWVSNNNNFIQFATLDEFVNYQLENN